MKKDKRFTEALKKTEQQFSKLTKAEKDLLYQFYCNLPIHATSGWATTGPRVVYEEITETKYTK